MTQLIKRQGFAPTTLTEAMEFSRTLAASSMVPKQYQGKPEDVLVCVQWGMELGLAPMQALQNIAVINGKPSVYGDAALALVQASPVCEGVEETMEGEGSPNPTAVCICHRKNRLPVTGRFSVEDAKRAGLWGKQGPWQAYPKRMLQMRARGFALRDAFPDVLKGLITAEEAQDYPDEKDITPAVKANPLDQLATKPAQIELSQTADQLKQEFAAHGIEVIEVKQVVQEVPQGLHKLFVPGKTEPHNFFNDIMDWIKAYEDLAERTARAGKVEHRKRMTKLRELKEANEAQLAAVPKDFKDIQTKAYNSRLAALGVSVKPDEKDDNNKV